MAKQIALILPMFVFIYRRIRIESGFGFTNLLYSGLG